jgi:hypothetical protein
VPGLVGRGQGMSSVTCTSSAISVVLLRKIVYTSEHMHVACSRFDADTNCLTRLMEGAHHGFTCCKMVLDAVVSRMLAATCELSSPQAIHMMVKIHT